MARLTFIPLLLFLLSRQADAAVTFFTPGELALLPKYCADSMYADRVAHVARYKYWANIMGPTFTDIHHYCAGLVELSRGRGMPKGSPQRYAMLKDAMHDFDYVLRAIRHSKQPAPLLPEILLRRGDAAAELADWKEAFSSYSESIKHKPDYWPAYLAWAEVLLSVGEKSEARAFLLQGLTHAPDAEPLRQLYVKAGGALKDIPVQAPPPAPDQAASAPAENGSQ